MSAGFGHSVALSIVLVIALICGASRNRRAQKRLAARCKGDSAGGCPARLYRAGTRPAGGRGEDPGLDLEPAGQVGAAGHRCQSASDSRCGDDCGEREPGRLDRRAGEELARLECQLRHHFAVRRAEGLEQLAESAGRDAASGLTAQGQSTTDSSLATTFGAEVVDVLPNGMLVVQATRQLTFSQQTQLIKLRGLVRPEDVSNQNQVLSTAMTDLELEVTGKGIVNDSTYRQNPLVRLLEKLVVF